MSGACQMFQDELQGENCYLVYTGRGSLEVQMVLADQGELGHDEITDHFPHFKWALDLDEIADLASRAKDYPMFSTGPYWFRKPQHYLVVAVQHGAPVYKFVVQALDLPGALAMAARIRPGCLFDVVCTLEQLDSASDTFMSVLDGRAIPVPVIDLRTRRSQHDA